MITETDRSVQPSTPSHPDATEPFSYLLKVERTPVYLGAVRMASRYIKKTLGVHLRVSRCEPPIPGPVGPLGMTEVAESTLLIELDRDAPDAVTQWAKILGVQEIELRKVTAEQAKVRLNNIASLHAASKPKPTIPESIRLSWYWNPVDAKSYVGFNGNASHHRRRLRGHGYRLIGSTGKGWLHKAGYGVPEGLKERWRTAARFLKDLNALASRFGLVVAGWHPVKEEWRSLADMRSMVKHREGRRWLHRCLVRIYTQADYLSRWRRHFAEQMGFTSIPGAQVDDLPLVQKPETTAIRSGLDLDRWMNDMKLTNKELAEKLKVTEAWVSYQRSGKKPWSKGFQQKLEKLEAGMNAGEKEK
jgi:hypothetical protein